MHYECPNCHSLVEKEMSTCPNCFKPLKETVVKSYFGFGNITPLSVITLLIYIGAMIVEIISAATLKNAFPKNGYITANITLPVIAMVVGIIVAVIALFAALGDSTNGDFVPTFILSIALMYLLMKIHTAKTVGTLGNVIGFSVCGLFIGIFIALLKEDRYVSKKVITIVAGVALGYASISSLYANILSIPALKNEPILQPYLDKMLLSLNLELVFDGLLLLTSVLLIFIGIFCYRKIAYNVINYLSIECKDDPIVQQKVKKALPIKGDTLTKLECAKYNLDNGFITLEEFKEIKANCLSDID